MRLNDGLWIDEVAYDFHIKVKDNLRRMIDEDPKSEGSCLNYVLDMPLNESLAYYEKGDGRVVKNEMFLKSMTDNYFEIYEKFKPSDEEKKVARKMILLVLALYRNDSAYFERIGGVITYVIKNYKKFKCVQDDPWGDYTKLLIGVYKWWKMNDKRKRTKRWIAWMFIHVIKKYQENQFYRHSVNWALIFLYVDHAKWEDDVQFSPDRWFPRSRGKFSNALYGGMY